jgi:hypothetical protein
MSAESGLQVIKLLIMEVSKLFFLAPTHYPLDRVPKHLILVKISRRLKVMKPSAISHICTDQIYISETVYASNITD